MAEGRIALAAEAFVYGFPLVFDLQEVDRFTRVGFGSVPATPFNRFGHAPSLAGPEERFVSINNDTVYSAAQVDLRGGPLLLEVPDTAGRYYVLQFIDAWTNNFAHVGHRATNYGSGWERFLQPPATLHTNSASNPLGCSTQTRPMSTLIPSLRRHSRRG